MALNWRYHCWRNHEPQQGDHDPFRSFDEVAEDTERVQNDAHFTALLSLDGKVICGMTHRGTDLLLEFDPERGTFESLGFPSVAERHEIKLHRGLTHGKDGKLYFGTASLMRTSDCDGTPGGRLFRYDRQERNFEVLGRPMAGTYIQSICLDGERGRIYGNTWPARYFFDFDLATQQTKSFYVENVPEGAPCLDADGRVWSMYGFGYSKYQLLCRYDPDAQEMEWTRLMLPGGTPGEDPAVSGETILWRGGVYFAAAGLSRLDRRAMAIDDLGLPVLGSERIPALAIGPDGLLYGVAGTSGDYHLFRFDGDTFNDLGQVRSSDVAAYIPHAICFVDDRIYVGETDTPERSGYLWEAVL